MTVYGHILPGAVSLANWAARTSNISNKAKQRLKVVDWLRSHSHNISLTSRHFGLNRETIRIWLKRFNQSGMMGLNDRSHRPKNPRKPSTNWQTVSEIVKTRKRYPAWSKYKIKRILSRQGIIVSSSAIARILKRKGLISRKASIRRIRASKNPKKRFPRGLKIAFAGALIQIDTKQVNLIGGRRIYQFTATDVLSKKRVLRYYSSLASINGADFLRYCLSRLPFKIMAVQTDNGPEFLKHFDSLCKELNIIHYFIEPRKPKQNTYVETSHLADEKEFYQQGNVGCELELMQEKLAGWEYTWNHIRPHEALGYLTPDEYLDKLNLLPLPVKDIIVLQT